MTLTNIDTDEITRRLGRDRLILNAAKTKLVPFTSIHRDDPKYLSWLRDYEVIKTLGLPEYLVKPASYKTIASYCDDLIHSPTNLFLAIYDNTDETFIGTIKAGHINWYSSTADIGIMIGDRTRWGKGLAKDGISILCQYLFESTKLRRLTAGAMSNNPAMCSIFDTLGFKQEGILRKQDRFENSYCDHIYFGCFANELRPVHIKKLA